MAEEGVGWRGRERGWKCHISYPSPQHTHTVNKSEPQNEPKICICLTSLFFSACRNWTRRFPTPDTTCRWQNWPRWGAPSAHSSSPSTSNVHPRCCPLTSPMLTLVPTPPGRSGTRVRSLCHLGTQHLADFRGQEDGRFKAPGTWFSMRKGRWGWGLNHVSLLNFGELLSLALADLESWMFRTSLYCSLSASAEQVWTLCTILEIWNQEPGGVVRNYTS